MRIVVLGGGYAGLALARELEDRLGEGHELLLVDEDGEHLVQQELHRVVRAPELAAEIVLDLDDALERFEVVEARVEAVDTEERRAELSNEAGDADADAPEAIEYDVCAVCLGAEPATQVEGAREHATPLKRLEHAEAIHERAVEVIDGATVDAAPSDDATDDAKRDDGASDDGDGPARIVVAGAGLSGVQVAGELAALARERGDDVGEVDEPNASDAGASVEVTILEQESEVAPGFEPDFRATIRDALEECGVDVRTGARIERVGADVVELAGSDGDEGDEGSGAHEAGESGESLAHDQVVWTGGIAGSSALGGERPQVDARLLLGDRTFGVGDAVRVVDSEGRAVPATAQAAVREAKTVAESVERLVDGGDGVFDPRLARFTFDATRWAVSIGDGAVAQVGPKVLTGSAARALKASVGAGYLGSLGAYDEALAEIDRALGLKTASESDESSRDATDRTESTAPAGDADDQ